MTEQEDERNDDQDAKVPEKELEKALEKLERVQRNGPRENG